MRVRAPPFNFTRKTPRRAASHTRVYIIFVPRHLVNNLFSHATWRSTAFFFQRLLDLDSGCQNRIYLAQARGTRGHGIFFPFPLSFRRDQGPDRNRVIDSPDICFAACTGRRALLHAYERVVITIENRIWKAVRGVNDTDRALIWRHSHRAREKRRGAHACIMHRVPRYVYALLRGEISHSPV